jgi:hypothetical protein
MAQADVTSLRERIARLLVLAAHSRAAAHHETADKLTALVAELLIEIAEKEAADEDSVAITRCIVVISHVSRAC